MFVKYGSHLFNAGKVHFRLDKNFIYLLDNSVSSPIFSMEFRNTQMASFAYERITHGLLNNWRCVDITQQIINKMLENRERIKPARST